MAPTQDLFARDDGCGFGFFFNGFECQRKSGWFFWGRWVVVGIAVAFGLAVLFCCLCISRRNRRRGVRPMYGTGWLGGAPAARHSGSNKPNTNNNNSNNNNGYEMNNYQSGYTQQQPTYGEGYGYTSPPPYGQPPVPNQTTGTTFNANDGYMTSQPQYGVQHPQSAYQPEGHYQPPAGPPPGK